jgi:nucleoside-diphosphate-sugar epimerase
VRMLVLGGSWFVGRVVVEDAAGRGLDVTVFNRGRSSAAPPPGVRVLHGDRERRDDLRALVRHAPWDVVVDVAGSVPAVVRRSVDLLTHATDRYVFVSTVSAYRDWPHEPVDEGSALWQGDPDFDPGTRAWDPDAVGQREQRAGHHGRHQGHHDHEGEQLAVQDAEL